MAKRRLVDTNVIIRYLVQDHEKHAKLATRLFDACDRGELVIVVLPSVLAESVFVLESFYQASRIDIASALVRLISSPGSRYEKSRSIWMHCAVTKQLKSTLWIV